MFLFEVALAEASTGAGNKRVDIKKTLPEQGF
jgi:hypothetical protein